MAELLNSLFKNQSLTRKIRERGTVWTINLELLLQEPGELWHLVILPPVLSSSSESGRATGTSTGTARHGAALGGWLRSIL